MHEDQTKNSSIFGPLRQQNGNIVHASMSDIVLVPTENSAETDLGLKKK
jgi:hypothetical protein